jgi:hypothetical protein
MAFGRGGAGADIPDWERELTRPDSHPAVATVVGLAVLVGGAVLFVRALPEDASGLIALSYALVAPPIVWAIGYAVTIRHASTVWKLLSLMLLGLGALVSVAVMVQVRMYEASRELSSMLEMKMDANGKLSVPEGKGPISRLMFGYIRDVQSAQEQVGQQVDALGIKRIGNPRQVADDPKLLKDCGRFQHAEPIADHWLATVKARSARLQQDVQSVRANERVKRGVLIGFVAAQTRTAERLKAQAELLKNQLVTGGRLCLVLARRHWRYENGIFGFTSRADLDEFRDVAHSWDYFAQQQQQAIAESRMQFQADLARARIEMAN